MTAMHTIKQLPQPLWPHRFPPPFKATYSHGPYIYGQSIAPDPIAAYHGAVLQALRMHQVNARRQLSAR